MSGGYDDQGYDEPPPAAPAAPAAPDYAAELQKLAGLRDQGVISDADFEAKKKQILGI
ncbi:MAG TPA: SHOCT domain-containing protein [Gaiellaceae bacterium]|nr:SHOCT domain-containing protein [Gaiellaceae bacterium]